MIFILLGPLLRFLRYLRQLRSYSWLPEADIGAGVDINFLVGRANKREI